MLGLMSRAGRGVSASSRSAAAGRAVPPPPREPRLHQREESLALAACAGRHAARGGDPAAGPGGPHRTPGQALHDQLVAGRGEVPRRGAARLRGPRGIGGPFVKTSLTESARPAAAAIKPGGDGHDGRPREEAGTLRDTLSATAQQQLDGVAAPAGHHRGPPRHAVAGRTREPAAPGRRPSRRTCRPASITSPRPSNNAPRRWWTAWPPHGPQPLTPGPNRRWPRARRASMQGHEALTAHGRRRGSPRWSPKLRNARGLAAAPRGRASTGRCRRCRGAPRAAARSTPSTTAHRPPHRRDAAPGREDGAGAALAERHAGICTTTRDHGPRPSPRRPSSPSPAPPSARSPAWCRPRSECPKRHAEVIGELRTAPTEKPGKRQRGTSTNCNRLDGHALRPARRGVNHASSFEQRIPAIDALGGHHHRRAGTRGHTASREQPRPRSRALGRRWVPSSSSAALPEAVNLGEGSA